MQITKHHCHGMNLQVLAGPGAAPVGVRGVARLGPRDEGAPDLGIERELAAAGLPALPIRLSRRGARQNSCNGKGKPKPERGQPRPRETPRTRGKGKRK